MFRESLWYLGSVDENIVRGLTIVLPFNRTYANTGITFVNLLPLMSSRVRDTSAFSDVLMSVTALSWRYRIVRLSIPSRSAGVT